MNRAEVKQQDIVVYLRSLGFQPKKIRNNHYWYLSPLRENREPSFKVNRSLNIWYGHGLGRVENIIDFGMLYYNCSFKEAIEKLQNNFSFHPQTITIQHHHINSLNTSDAVEPKIKVIAAKPPFNLFLCSYLSQRKIPLTIAKDYCEEVHYELHGRQFFAIGFKDNLSGYELRNAHFKGSSSPKNVTLIETYLAKEVVVFEGFFSVLSYRILDQNETPLTNFLVLNSFSFFGKSRSLMTKAEVINLYLDRDQAGMRCTWKALEWNKKYIDQSHRYKNDKDLNDYLVNQSLRQKQHLRLQRPF